MSETVVVIESITPNVSVEISNMQGPQGGTGPTGPTGATGPTGPTGPANGTATPSALGTAAAGTSTLSSHEDHVHPTTGLATSGANSNITSLSGLTTPLSAGQGGTGLSALGTGVATALGINVGTAGSPVVNGGALGTPSSGTLTSATGLPISTGVSGLGTGVATFLATPSSANLLSALTTETGTGNVVFGTGPTLSQPIIDNLKLGYTTTVSSGTAIVLTAASNYQQFITGTTAQTVTLPVATTMTLGQSFKIVNNNTTGDVTVNSSGGNLVITVPPGFNAEVVSILLTGTTAASWSASYCDFDTLTGTGSVVLSASPTLTGTPTLPTGTIATTQTAGNSTTAVATTAFVTTADNLKANLAGPTFTGTVTVPISSITSYQKYAVASLTTPVTGTTYSVVDTDTYIVFNRNTAITVTLPTASSYTGRMIHIKTINSGAVSSATSNVIPIAGGAAAATLFSAAAAGKFTILVSNGTNWEIMAQN